MAQITYQVTLSMDGNHSVSVTGDDPVAVKTELAWAKGIYDQLVARLSPKDEEPENEGEAPVCAVHDLPMVRQRGRYGPFWSCHQRNDDGGFCSYRPDSS